MERRRDTHGETSELQTREELRLCEIAQGTYKKMAWHMVSAVLTNGMSSKHREINSKQFLFKIYVNL